MIGGDRRAADVAAGLFEHGIDVQDFRSPVVPPGQARIRTQVTAGHSPDQLDRALAAFETVGRRVGIIGTGEAAPATGSGTHPPL